MEEKLKVRDFKNLNELINKRNEIISNCRNSKQLKKNSSSQESSKKTKQTPF